MSRMHHKEHGCHQNTRKQHDDRNRQCLVDKQGEFEDADDKTTDQVAYDASQPDGERPDPKGRHNHHHGGEQLFGLNRVHDVMVWICEMNAGRRAPEKIVHRNASQYGKNVGTPATYEPNEC